MGNLLGIVGCHLFCLDFALTGHMPFVTGAQDHNCHLMNKGTSVLIHWVACNILQNSFSVFLQLDKSSSINNNKNEERGRKSYLVPQIRKVKSSPENSITGPSSVQFQNSAATALGPFLCLFSLLVFRLPRSANVITGYVFL